jgi:hypothetical protein
MTAQDYKNLNFLEAVIIQGRMRSTAAFDFDFGEIRIVQCLFLTEG